MLMSSKSKSGSYLMNKRISCDECRYRKIACTKEAEGCARCVREVVGCHYSAKKIMGRPRKRRKVVDENHQHRQNIQTQDLPGETAYDLLLDEDMLQNSELLDVDRLPVPLRSSSMSRETDNSSDHSIYWQDHANQPLQSNSALLDYRNVLHSPGLTPGYDVNETVPTSISSPEASHCEVDQVFVPILACSCLASMYLALASLQVLPEQSSAALASIRKAADAARSVLRCPTCSAPIVSSMTTTVAGYQNIMLLGTILPLVVEGYKKLLTIIDSETEATVLSGAHRRLDNEFSPGTLDFDLVDAKGELSPGSWRKLFRAQVRAELHGREQGAEEDRTTPDDRLRGVIAKFRRRSSNYDTDINTLGKPLVRNLRELMTGKR